MIVAMIEKSSQRVVAEYPIIIHGQNYAPTDEEHFREAWKCAVEDGRAKASDSHLYEFRFADGEA